MYGLRVSCDPIEMTRLIKELEQQGTAYTIMANQYDRIVIMSPKNKA
jgi:hypothetical protein